MSNCLHRLQEFCPWNLVQTPCAQEGEGVSRRAERIAKSNSLSKWEFRDFRFDHARDMICCHEEPTMDADNVNPEKTDSPIERRLDRPLASAWLWRPWYAKLWWVSMLFYWGGKLASLWSEAVAQYYATALAGYLNILLYPFTALMVLGVGFAKAWMDYRGFEWGPPSQEQLFPKRSVGGLRDPYSDPLDPKSGMLHWRHFHPHGK